LEWLLPHHNKSPHASVLPLILRSNNVIMSFILKPTSKKVNFGFTKIDNTLLCNTVRIHKCFWNPCPYNLNSHLNIFTKIHKKKLQIVKLKNTKFEKDISKFEHSSQCVKISECLWEPFPFKTLLSVVRFLSNFDQGSFASIVDHS